MSVEDLEPRRFERNFHLSLSEADLGLTSAPELFLVFFFKFGTFCLKNRAHGRAVTSKVWRVSLEFKVFCGKFAFPLA